MNLVVVRVRVALHAEELRARLPDGDRDVVQGERLRDGAGHAQQGQPVAARAEFLDRLPPGLVLSHLPQGLLLALAGFDVFPKGSLLRHNRRSG